MRPKRPRVVQPARWAHRDDSSCHGPSSTTRPESSTTTRSACASAAALLVAPMTVVPPGPQRLPQLDLGGGVERGRHVVGQQHVGVASPAPGPARGAAPAHRRGVRRGGRRAASAPPASATSRPMRAASSAGTTDRSAWSRATLPVNVPDSTRGTCATWATRPGRSVVCGSSTRRSFQRISPVLLTRPASAPSRLDLPEPTWPSSRTSSPACDVEVDVAGRRACRRRAPRRGRGA